MKGKVEDSFGFLQLCRNFKSWTFDSTRMIGIEVMKLKFHHWQSFLGASREKAAPRGN